MTERVAGPFTLDEAHDFVQSLPRDETSSHFLRRAGGWRDLLDATFGTFRVENARFEVWKT